MTEGDKKEIEKILANAEKEAAFLRAKNLMTMHKKWKERHPRPNSKKESETE